MKDLAGNVMANDYVWSWTTSVSTDTSPPLVASTTIANGATGVAIDAKVGAMFSEGMDPLTVTNVNCLLTETVSGVAANAVTVSYSGGSVDFILDSFGPSPPSLLHPGTSYTVTIKGGVGGVEDLAGNPMTNDYQWHFTTARSNSIGSRCCPSRRRAIGTPRDC